MDCPTPFSIFVSGWCRAWTLIYFNPSIRDALSTLIQVFGHLGPLCALCLLSFVGHFFIFQALTVGVPGQAGFGTGGNIGGATYNLFCFLTTVNHPDVMMWLVDAKPLLTWLTIISYMFFTFIIGLNLLLAIVAGPLLLPFVIEGCCLIWTILPYMVSNCRLVHQASTGIFSRAS